MRLLSEGGSSFSSNIGGILSGISELLLALGAGLGFLIRVRRNAQRERLRSEAAASLAARETQKALEAKLDAQYTSQVEQLKTQISDLQKTNADLLGRLFEEHHD